jgi:peptide/nickel transport system substrate-binding protein
MARFTILLLGVAMLLAACGGGESKNTSGQAGSTSGAAGTAATGAATQREPKGELRIAFGIHMPGTLDSTKDGFSLIFAGVGETLTRLNIEQKAEPWLAEQVTQTDSSTWRITLRRNATFHDGTPVTAEDVAASFQRNWESQPAANSFIPKETQIAVIDPYTLEFKLPRPVGGFLNNLAAFQFVVHKPGTSGSIMTGPYKPVRLATDNQLTLEAFTGHWGGPPPIARITIKNVPDANARALALQSGDVDMVFAMPPEQANGLPADIEKAIIPSTRMHMMLMNQSRAPFDDRRVREATALAIDRDALNRTALAGLGAVAVNIFPPNTAVEVVPAQSTDVSRARQLLDEAGWRAGSDGVRVKDGKRLAFTLYSYPGRAELTPMAVLIQSQLKQLGYDIQIQQVQNITSELGKGEWDASMYSIGTLPTGDPLYVFTNTLTKAGSSNPSGYDSPQLNAVLDQLRPEVDPAKRQALAKQAQEVVRAEVPNVYLVGAPVVYLYKKGKVTGFKPNPNDLYFIDSSFTVN